MAKSFIDRLLETRKDYARELARHRFLMDAYSATGGFAGRERQPFSGYWGAAAELYARSAVPMDISHDSESSVETYLDRFIREDVEKFRRRAGIAHYPNYIAPAIDIPMSFMFRKPLSRSPKSEGMGALQEFLDDCNGAGMPWDDMLRDVIALRAGLLGWTPVAFDIFGEDDSTTEGAPFRTALDDIRERRRPVAVPLFPANLLEWKADETGTLQWVKIRQDREESDDPFSDRLQITRITIWTKSEFHWWDMVKRDGGEWSVKREKRGKNPFGEVPVMVMRRKPLPDDPFRGIPMAGAASDEARRLFNALSELDEHMRACAYALLQIPIKDAAKLSTITGGNGNAVPVDPESNRDYKWVTPDTNVSVMYETRVANIIEEIFRMQHMEFTRSSKAGGVRSGVSQAFEFESANRNIANFARQLAMFDQSSLRLVAHAMQPRAPKREDIRTTASTRFDVQEMTSVLTEARESIDLGLGALAEAEIKKRLVVQLLPNLEPETLQGVFQEIDAATAEEVEQRKDGATRLADARAALADGNATDDEEDDDEAGDGASE